MSPRLTLCCLALLASCSRDLSIPPAPPVLPGAVFGRVVIAVPGRAEKQPAKGAQVALLGSSLSVTAGEDGRFALTEVNQSTGKLLFRYVEGTHVRQKLISLEEIGAGKNRQVSLGDVLVAENASIVGKALRSELAESRMGHRGTVVFVPEGPFLTYTADDGSFELANLPEGAIEVGFFRSGYQSLVLPALSLRGGELLTLRDVVLAPEPNPAPGAILGTVKFAPPLEDATGALAVASADGVTRQASAVASGDFQLEDLPAGLYAVQLSRPSYSPTTVFNVLVVSGQSTRLSDIVLGQGSSFDAGQPPGPPDASVDPSDAGTDAGTDGGSDAGVDAGLMGCTQQLDCGSGEWCDDGFCVPQCTPGSCSNGRVCELGTRTCVTPCDGGCPAQTTCDLSINACAALCGGPVTCAPGFVCNATTSLCESECSTSRPCPNHYSCSAGQCVSLGTCDLDTDCPRTRVCLNGTCAARSADGGAACTTACGCRLDETCEYDAGQCVIVAPPTLFFFPDAGGDGLSTATPSGSLPALASIARRGDVIAMLAGTTATFTGPIALDGGVTLSGGYVDCGPNRWVRDDTARSSLEGGTTSIDLTGSPVEPREDITLRNLQVSSVNVDGAAAVSANQVSRFTVENVVPRLRPIGPANGFAFLRCTNCTDVRFSKVGLPPSPNANTAMSLVQLIGSSGQVDQLWVEDTAQKQLYGVLATTLSGPLSVTNSRIGVVTANVENGLIRVDDCSAYPLTVTGNQLRWPNISDLSEGRAMVITYCDDLTFTGNLVDGRGQSATLRASEAQSAAFSIYNASGTIANNAVFFPAGVSGGAVAFDLRGPELDIDFHHNVSDGGVNLAFATALRIENVSLGDVDVHDNQLGAHGATDVRGVDLDRIGVAAGLNFHDNDVFVDAPATMAAKGLFITDGVNGRFERNVVVVGASGITHGLLVANGGANVNLELLQNLFRVGAGVAPGSFSVGSFGWEINSAGQYTFIGNSLEMNPDPTQPGPSMALQCSNSAAVMTVTSNIIGAGNKPSATSILGSTGSTCYPGSTFQKNYAWHTAAALAGMDQTGTQFTADAGSFDSNGNILAPGTSPYAASGSFELGASSLCIDRGLAGVRSDASPITLDALRRPRVVGSSADIGGTEKQ